MGKVLWTFLNSPLFLTVLTVGLGTLVAAWLTARWQRASLIFQLRADTIRRLFEQHVRWSDSFYQSNPSLTVDRLTELLPTIKFVSVIFPEEEIEEAVGRFWDAADVRSRAPLTTNAKKLQELRDTSHQRFQEMMDHLAKRVGMSK